MASPPRNRAFRALLWIALATAALMAMWLFSVGPTSSTPAAAHTGTRGPHEASSPGLQPRLSVFRRLGGGLPIERLVDGAHARPGDRVQVAYRSGGRPFAVVVSIDGEGEVTLHHPRHPDDTPLVEPHGEHALESSFELDDAPDFEHFIMVASSRPITVRSVLDAAEALTRDGDLRAPLALPRGCVQTSFTLAKHPR